MAGSLRRNVQTRLSGFGGSRVLLILLGLLMIVSCGYGTPGEWSTAAEAIAVQSHEVPGPLTKCPQSARIDRLARLSFPRRAAKRIQATGGYVVMFTDHPSDCIVWFDEGLIDSQHRAIINAVFLYWPPRNAEGGWDKLLTPSPADGVWGPGTGLGHWAFHGTYHFDGTVSDVTVWRQRYCVVSLVAENLPEELVARLTQGLNNTCMWLNPLLG
jgi:hypothetical protein